MSTVRFKSIIVVSVVKSEVEQKPTKRLKIHHQKIRHLSVEKSSQSQSRFVSVSFSRSSVEAKSIKSFHCPLWRRTTKLSTIVTSCVSEFESIPSGTGGKRKRHSLCRISTGQDVVVRINNAKGMRRQVKVKTKIVHSLFVTPKRQMAGGCSFDCQSQRNIRNCLTWANFWKRNKKKRTAAQSRLNKRRKCEPSASCFKSQFFSVPNNIINDGV